MLIEEEGSDLREEGGNYCLPRGDMDKNGKRELVICFIFLRDSWTTTFVFISQQWETERSKMPMPWHSLN